MFGLMPYTNRIATRDNDSFINPFNDDFFRAFFGNAAPASTFKVDVEDKGDSYLLKADLPGVSKDNVKISIDNGIMTISATMNESNEEKRGNYVYRERRQGSMSRCFNMDGISEEGITAEYKDGVLMLNMPKIVEETPKAREITIN